MDDHLSTQDLRERVALIEDMIAEGRRSTESWGWIFVLWGIAYYAAILGGGVIRNPMVWPVTMTTACIVTGILVATRRGQNHVNTTIGRAIGAVWLAAGISMFLVFLSLGTSGRIDQHIMVAVLGAMLGSANAASAMILKWKLQLRLCRRVVGLCSVRVLREEHTAHNCVFDCHFHLPDRVRHLRDDDGRSPA